MPQPRKERSTRAWVIIALMVIFAGVAVVRPFARRAPGGPPAGSVEHVIDGDTVHLADGRRIRYIGIDTPELDSTSDRTRRLAREAQEFNSRLVEGKTVRLEFDVEVKDRYARTLAYVWEGETFVNAELVREGLARAKVYGRNTRYAEELERLEKIARTGGKGLWAAE